MLNSPLGGRRGIGFGLGRSWQRGGFSPTDIAGLQLWLDFSDASTLFVDAGITPVSADGDLIYQANDKSGNGRHGTQATLDYRPLYKTGIQNSLSGGYWDGINDYMSGSPYNFSRMMTFVVVDIDDVSTNKRLLSHRQDAWDDYNGLSLAIATRGMVNTTHGIFMETLSPSISQYIYTFVMGGTNAAIYVNNSLEITDTYTDYMVTPIELIIGARYDTIRSIMMEYFKGHILEIIQYNSALSDVNRQSVESYLNNKWAIY